MRAFEQKVKHYSRFEFVIKINIFKVPFEPNF